MGINKKVVVFVLILVASCFCIEAHPLRICRLNSIYQLGDSISDTGNLIRETPSTPFAKLPYGQNFFNKTPTGRCSNGLLMVDYFAMAAGLPLTHPYLAKDGDFRHGVNFAVAGSTALPPKVLAGKRIISPVPSSLDVQLGWLSSHLNSTCPLDHKDCAEKLEHALFMVGEIGGNDYNYAILQRKTRDELTSMVPDVVGAIMNATREVVRVGAKRVVVPGNFPIGCLPVYKTAFETEDSRAYDANKCLKGLNELAVYHNAELQRGIRKMVEEEKPNAIVVYADYYNAYQFLLRFSKSRGFDTERACCGWGGKYNFNMNKTCGADNSQVCENPDEYMSWDGVHLTQEGYKIMAAWLVLDLFPNLHCHLF